MATKKQIAANKRNAQKSTGPKTLQGKKRVAMNPLKHGLTSKVACLPFEDRAAFKKIGKEIYEKYKPVDTLQKLLVPQIAFETWRQARVYRIEVGIMTLLSSRRIYRACKALSKTEKEGVENKPLDSPNPAIVDPEETEEIAYGKDEATEAEKWASTDAAKLGAAFIMDMQALRELEKISRYKTAIERSLIAKIREIERLQSERHANEERG